MKLACRGDIRSFISNFSYNCTKNEKLTRLRTVKSILWQVTKGVEEAHQLGYVLRDIKPENILIRHDRTVLVSDFGLVAPVGLIDESLCGTPEYMAPERLSKKRISLPIDASVDIWSLGILSYELMMGYTPYTYEDDDISGLLESMYGGYVSFDEELPSYCKNFVFSLLQTNPNKRLSLEQVKQHKFF